MRRVWTHVAAFVGGFLGFYAGLIALIAAGGLDSAGWAPLFMSTGAGLLAGGAIAIVGESASARIVAIGGVGGLLLGAVFTAFDPDLTIVAVTLAVSSQALAALPTSRWAGA